MKWSSKDRQVVKVATASEWTVPPIVDLSDVLFSTDPHFFGPGLIGAGDVTLKLSTVADCTALMEAILETATRLVRTGAPLS